ncbi:Crp/Fnr family transcriptional regulator [Rhizobium lentis]|uniref:CRP-like cAMP-binding protein n=1 Tax=Rhizobium lentis TaxID=1138194 RepID=A0A7W8XF96_9HYPH|nr:Crp/Fnr family transcriptional regulator [Rhizobium lentis]MBB5551037.1 CRP-like cAMP-binding protein [Rhizobium lentis]MBB5561572.1 CRP-like cAMP-binding protein [Rhizobium lentis]MBB5568156.1 CRP-like cAMP-binding protein [Rhizobium lentis]
MRNLETHNFILSHLTDSELLALERILEPLLLPRDFNLVHSGTAVSHYYFLESGIASMVAASPEGRKAEIGLIGRDGVSPPVLIMEGQKSPFQVTMQVGGHGRRVEAHALGAFLHEQPAVLPLLSHSLQIFFAQVAHTALSNAVHKIDVRLAKWILMCQDRLEGREIAITHEYLATMLGVRRSSVTDALHILEGEHLIYSSRGLVIVRDRAALEAFAADAYDLNGYPTPGWSRSAPARAVHRLPLVDLRHRP